MEIEIDETKLDELIIDAKDASIFTGSNSIIEIVSCNLY